MAQWARMPEYLRRKRNAVIAAQQLGPAIEATTRRSRSQDKDSSLSPAYESRAPALRMLSLVRCRQYQCYGEDVLRLHPRARRADRVAWSTMLCTHLRRRDHPFPPYLHVHSRSRKARLRQALEEEASASSREFAPRSINATVDAYRVYVSHGCKYEYPRDVFGIFEQAGAIVDHWKVHAEETDLEVDPNYRKKGGMCERQKREGDVNCQAHDPGPEPCHWKGMRRKLM